MGTHCIERLAKGIAALPQGRGPLDVLSVEDAMALTKTLAGLACSPIVTRGDSTLVAASPSIDGPCLASFWGSMGAAVLTAYPLSLRYGRRLGQSPEEHRVWRAHPLRLKEGPHLLRSLVAWTGHASQVPRLNGFNCVGSFSSLPATGEMSRPFS